MYEIHHPNGRILVYVDWRSLCRDVAERAVSGDPMFRGDGAPIYAQGSDYGNVRDFYALNKPVATVTTEEFEAVASF